MTLPEGPNRCPEGAPVRRHRSWLLLAAIVVGGLLITTAVFFLWLRSTSDLDGLRRELQAEHVPTTWEELDLHLSPPATLATWKRIGELSKVLKPFAIQYPVFNGTTASLTPFSPVPDAARIQHAMLDQDRLEELRACVDALGDQRLELRTQSDFFTSMDEFGIERSGVNLLTDEALLADPTRIAPAFRRLLRFVAVQPCGTMLSHLVRISQTQIAFAAVAGRLEALKGAPQRVDDLVEELATLAVAELPDMETREMLNAWTTFVRHPTLNDQISITNLGWLDAMLRPALLRAGRAGFLRREAGLIHRYAQGVGAAGPDALIADLEQEARTRRYSPAGFMVLKLGNYDAMICQMSYECRLHGLLLLAELRGQAWPRDPFDPAHPQLRALVRAGRTVGAYSVGRDGVDHLGKRPDHYFPLLERFEPLKPAP
ncbi:MAG: hypothetical protein H0X38_03315 [Planctomycetes bacterium]|nr:hypothetical protein [Planctomycetota bacterium]